MGSRHFSNLLDVIYSFFLRKKKEYFTSHAPALKSSARAEVMPQKQAFVSWLDFV